MSDQDASDSDINSDNGEGQVTPGGLEAVSGGLHQIYATDILNETPLSFGDIDKSPNRIEWLQATQDEFDSLKNNGTWILTDLPPGRQALKCKWLWRMKFDADGKMTKFKARLVLKGYMQKFGVDYLEIFAPVLRLNTLRLLLCLYWKNVMANWCLDMEKRHGILVPWYESNYMIAYLYVMY